MIGGKVLDASALAALHRGYLSAVTWFAVAETQGLVLYVPSLAIFEVQAVRPGAAEQLTELRDHPWVLTSGELDASTAAAIDQLLDTAGVFDALAGHVVYVCRQRGWPALSADPDRLRRVDPHVAIDPL